MFVVETPIIFHSPIARTRFQGSSKNKTAQIEAKLLPQKRDKRRNNGRRGAATNKATRDNKPTKKQSRTEKKAVLNANTKDKAHRSGL